VPCDQVFDKLINNEGGYVFNPPAPGGETKSGISKRSSPHLDIHPLTLSCFGGAFIQDGAFMIGPLSEDQRAERMFEQGSRQLLYSITRALAGLPTYSSPKLLWNERNCKTVRDPDSISSQLTREWEERQRARDILADNLRIKPRDPCPVCATRQDIGCAHIRENA